MESWEQARSFVSRDLSRGGMFLAMPDAAPPGTLLEMVIALPDGSELTVRGQVCHAVSRERARAEARRAGVGVKFVGLDAGAKQRIGKVVDAAHALAQGSTTLPAPVVSEPPDTDLLAAVRSQLGELKEHDYFQVLGIAPNSSADEVERGFRKRLEEWDPEALADQSPEIREVVAEIVILLHQAHAALADAGYRTDLARRTKPRRQKIDELFEDVPLDDATGEPAPLELGELELAKTESGVRVSPSVARSRTAREAGDYEQASRILTAALAEAPADRQLLIEYHLTMGYGELSRDRLDLAARHFDEVIRIDPNHAQAILEIRRLSDQPRKQKRALLGRLLSRSS